MDVATRGWGAGSLPARTKCRIGAAALLAAALLFAHRARGVQGAETLLGTSDAAAPAEPYMLFPPLMSGAPLGGSPLLETGEPLPAADDFSEMLRLPPVDLSGPADPSGGAPGDSAWNRPLGRGVALANFVQDSNREAAATSGGTKAEGSDALGKAPANNTLQFLRRQTVLLAPGQHQFDIGLSYSLYNTDYPLPVVNTPGGPIVSVVRERIRQRIMLIPMELRVGVTDRTQVFFDLPVGWADSELAYQIGQSHNDIVGLGDVRAGFSSMVRQGCGGDSPDIVATFAGVAPTGNPGNPLLTGINTGNRLGQGFWQFQTSVLFVHTYDPLVVFYGCGYVHRFGNEIAGNYYQAGEEFDYQCGVGFAVNPTCTVSSSFLGAYITQWQLNNQPIYGSTLEIQRMRFSITMVKSGRIVEPFAEVGMTVYSPTSRVGITWTF